MPGILRQDLRCAIRTLGRNPTFTLVVVVTLSLALGLNTAIFSVTYGVLLRALPYRDPGRLVTLMAETPEYRGPGFSYANYQALKEAGGPFDELAVFYQHTGISRVTLTGPEPEMVQAGFVSANFFPLLGVSPAIGRVFSGEEETRRERLAILSDALWRRRFGGSAEAIGARLQVDGAPFLVIGIMPPEFQLPARDVQFWAPLTANPWWGDFQHGPRAVRWNMIGRLSPELAPAAAESEVNAIAGRLEQECGGRRCKLTVRLEPLRPPVAGPVRQALTMLSGAAFFVLLIACANVANLLLARGAARERELALRVVLGAGRGRLIRHLLTETAVLAGISGAVGLTLAAWVLEALPRFLPTDIPRVEQVGIDGAAMAFTGAACLLAMALAGAAPAWKISQRDPNELLKGSTRMLAGSRQSGNPRRLLVVGEFALAMALLAGAGLLIRSFLAVRALDLGFEPGPALLIRVYLPAGSTAAANVTYMSQALERLAGVPGVLAAGGVDDMFQLGAAGRLGFRMVEGREPESSQQWTALTWGTVSGEYFRAAGAKLLKGRFFSEQDGVGSAPVAIIDESLARRYWPGEDPIGKRFKGQDARGRNDDWLTVIGVIRDLRHGLERQPTPHVYEWYRQSGKLTRDIVVRTQGDPSSIAAAARAAVRSVDGTAVIARVTTLEQEVERHASERRFETWLMGLFALTGMGLAGIGIYGLMYYAVAQRTREIAIRMAIGARVEQVLGMVLREGFALALTGAGAGLLGAWWLNRLLEGLLYGVRPGDPWTLASACLILVAAALFASFLPAWRATKVDPIAVLRFD